MALYLVRSSSAPNSSTNDPSSSSEVLRRTWRPYSGYGNRYFATLGQGSDISISICKDAPAHFETDLRRSNKHDREAILSQCRVEELVTLSLNASGDFNIFLFLVSCLPTFQERTQHNKKNSLVDVLYITLSKLPILLALF